MRTVADMLFDIALASGRYADPRALARFDNRTYSQNGEDGVIAEIFRRIGVQSRYFVEFGVEDGRQNNTRLLLEQGWRGLWIDGNADAVASASEIFAAYIASGALRIVAATITVANVSALLDAAEVPASIDFLSLDVDHNTSHIWRALNRRTRVACIEYAASLPASAPLEVPYDPTATWDGSNWFGASLKTLELIGASKGMHLVGCELTGVNAFFVAAEDTHDRFLPPFTAEAHHEPPRYQANGSRGHMPATQARRWLTPADAIGAADTTIDVRGAGPLSFRLHPTADPWVSGVIRRGDLFDPLILTALRTLLGPGDTLLDVGGNIGWFTVIGSRLVGPTGQVIAIEPEPANAALLAANLAGNDCRNVLLHQVAAGAEATTARLYLDTENFGDHRMAIASARTRWVDVDVRPLDTLLDGGRQRVDLLKMDTQGSEVHALRGMRALLATNPAMRMVIEFWPHGLENCGSDAADLLALLTRQPRLFWLIRSQARIDRITPEALLALADGELSPASEGHGDIVVLSATDEAGIQRMAALETPT